jgi:Ca2+-binding RTX toxin-like protein
MPPQGGDALRSFKKTVPANPFTPRPRAESKTGMPITIIKPSFAVNQTETGVHGFGDIVRLADGRLLVTWSDATESSTGAISNYNLMGRFLDANGDPIGDQFSIASTPVNEMFSVTAALSDGRVVVAWRERATSYGEVKARILNPDGTQSGAEMVVQTPAAFTGYPNVEVLPDGSIALGYRQISIATGADKIQYQIFNGSGAPTGTIFASPWTSGDLSESELTPLANGRYLMTWSEMYGPNTGRVWDIKGRIFNADGTVHRDTWTIDALAGPPSVTALANGNVVVAWSDYVPGTVSTARAMILNANGDVVVPSFAVSGDSRYGVDDVETVTLSDGRFAIAWEQIRSTGTSVAYEVILKVFNADGTVSIAQQAVASSRENIWITDIDMQALPGGRIALTWSDWQPSGGTPIRTVIIGTQASTVPSPEADALTGTAGNDVIDGLGGDDAIAGQAGDDWLVGGTGNDNLDGSDGNDNLTGGAGADALTGGAGFDYARHDYAAGAIVARLDAPSLNTGDAAGDTYSGIEGLFGGGFDDILGGEGGTNHLFGIAGNDALYGFGGIDALYGGDGGDHLTGGTGSDILDGGAGFDYARYDYATGAVVARLDTPSANTGEAAGDIYVSIEGLVGCAFNDTLAGNNGANHLFGVAGDDFLYGLGGGDALYGGDGSDHLTGGVGADYLDGGAGTDFARYDLAASAIVARLDAPSANTGEAGGDSYVGIEGLVGSAFGDTLVGDNGANQLYGNAGHDLLYGQGGGDTLSGGDGNDHLAGGAGADYHDGGAGLDYARYDGAATALVLNLGYAAANTGEAQGDIYVGIEGLVGGAYADSISGDAGLNHLFGLGGGDYIFGLGGTDALYGGDGDDNLDGGASADRLDGGAGFDYARYDYATGAIVARLDRPFLNRGEAAGDIYAGIEGLVGGSAGDTLAGDGAANHLFGLAGNDTLYGFVGTDALYGGDGVDRLDGGIGNDFLYGGDGADVMLGTAGSDALEGGGGNDLLNGGADADFFFYDIASNFGQDRIIGFQNNIDKVYLVGTGFDFADFAEFEVKTGASTYNTVLRLLADPSQTITFIGIRAAAIDATDFV